MNLTNILMIFKIIEMTTLSNLQNGRGGARETPTFLLLPMIIAGKRQVWHTPSGRISANTF
jgi:hypothetical protein